MARARRLTLTLTLILTLTLTLTLTLPLPLPLSRLVLAAAKDERALTNALNPKYAGPDTANRARQEAEPSSLEAEGAPTSRTMLAVALVSRQKEKIKEDINAHGPHDVTALMLASSKGWISCVQKLLWMGADRHLKTSTGCTSLTIAAREGHSEVVKDLLHLRPKEGGEAAEADEAAADAAAAYANQAEESDVTALMRAAQGGFVKVGRVRLRA